MSKSAIPTNKPIRPDKVFFDGLTKAVFIMRLTVLALFFVCVMLAGVAVVSLYKPQLITVVDMSGRTSTSLGSNKMGDQVIEQQLIYYSREFCESFLNQDHVSIKDTRKTAVALMHPDLVKKLPKDYLDGNEVRMSRENKQTCYFDWPLKPDVIEKNDPRYSVYCEFIRETKKEGYEPIKTRYTIRLDWGRLIKNNDPFNRPHSLVLLNFENVQDKEKLDKYRRQIK